MLLFSLHPYVFSSTLQAFGHIMIQIRLAYCAIYTWADISIDFLVYGKAIMHCIALRRYLLINYIQIASNISRRRIKTHKHFI